MAQGEIAKLYVASHKGYGAGGFPAWGYPLIIANYLINVR